MKGLYLCLSKFLLNRICVYAGVRDNPDGYNLWICDIAIPT